MVANVTTHTKRSLARPFPFLKPDLARACETPPGHDHNRYESILAQDPVLLDKVFSLRYKSYSAQNYIEKNKTGRFMDEYDARKENLSFLTLYNGEAIGSIRACIYNPARPSKLPIMQPFHDEIQKHMGYDRPMVEANRFVVDPDFQRKGGTKARFGIFRNIIETAMDIHAHCILAAVRPEHVKFYRMLCFGPVTTLDPKAYPALNFSVVLLACRDIAGFKRLVWRKTDGEEIK